MMYFFYFLRCFSPPINFLLPTSINDYKWLLWRFPPILILFSFALGEGRILTVLLRHQPIFLSFWQRIHFTTKKQKRTHSFPTWGSKSLGSTCVFTDMEIRKRLLLQTFVICLDLPLWKLSHYQRCMKSSYWFWFLYWAESKLEWAHSKQQIQNSFKSSAAFNGEQYKWFLILISYDIKSMKWLLLFQAN